MFFSNLLPENDLRRYIADRAGVAPDDDFALLWVVGEDLPGAVTVHDPLGPTSPPVSIGGPIRPPDPRTTLRFSLAGVQLKFSAVENARGGLTIPVSGKDGDWIAKIPSVHFHQIPENEFAMLRLAQACGISVPAIRLVDLREIDGLPVEIGNLQGNVLAIRRFDREPSGGRIHIEDMNQVFRQKPGDKYQNRSFVDIAAFLGANATSSDVDDFLKRLVFNVAIANNDMHLKNWSLIYRDRVKFSLSPAYDYVCTKPYTKGHETGLAVGSAREFNAVTSEQLGRMAQRARLSPRIVLRSASDMVERMHEIWKLERDSVPDFAARVIDDQLVRIPLFGETYKVAISKYRAVTGPKMAM